MKTTLIPTLMLTIGLTAALPALAFPTAADQTGTRTEKAAVPMLQLSRRGSDDGPGDDHGGRGRGGDDGPGDDHGGDRTRGSDDDNGASGSGRRKPRVPGGSGCDDAGDVAEHSSCG